MSDPRLGYRPLNVLVRCSRAVRACVGATSCCRMHVDSKTSLTQLRNEERPNHVQMCLLAATSVKKTGHVSDLLKL
jgi:hypothetical protein